MKRMWLVLLPFVAQTATAQLAEITSISTIPSRVYPGQPFELIVSGQILSCLGFGESSRVNGTTITVNLDLFGGASCNPFGLEAMTVSVQGLTAGIYTVEVFENAAAGTAVFVGPIQIGANAISTLSFLGGLLLSLFIIGLAAKKNGSPDVLVGESAPVLAGEPSGGVELRG